MRKHVLVLLLIFMSAGFVSAGGLGVYSVVSTSVMDNNCTYIVGTHNGETLHATDCGDFEYITVYSDNIIIYTTTEDVKKEMDDFSRSILYYSGSTVLNGRTYDVFTGHGTTVLENGNRATTIVSGETLAVNSLRGVQVYLSDALGQSKTETQGNVHNYNLLYIIGGITIFLLIMYAFRQMRL